MKERETKSPPAETREQPPTLPVETKRSGRAATGFVFAQQQGAERRSIREVYSVFFRPASEADRDALSWASRKSVFEPGGDAGEPVDEQARLVLNAVGPRHDDLIAVPTSMGMVCYLLLPSGGGGCGHPVEHGLAIGGEDGNGGDLLYGMVGDAVRDMDAVVAGATYHARMGENAFAFVLPEPGLDKIDKLILHLRDGTIDELAL
jgi:hypothetical protein